MKRGFYKLLIIAMITVFALGMLGAASEEPSSGNAQEAEDKTLAENADNTADESTDKAEEKTEDKAAEESGEDKAPAEEDSSQEADKTEIEEYPAPYTMAWLDKYAPASVAPFEEQVGDNGEYPEEVIRPDCDTYELVVDYTNQCVYAFSKDEDGERQLERVMICTTGGNGDWTPEGEYEMHSDYQRFGRFVSFGTYAQYWSQMWGNFYFHSVIYNERDASTYTMSSYNNLGTPGSHGCIRLLVPDARWIYENCAPGTKCTVTTDYKKNPALKKALRNGYEGATDYIAPDEETEQES